MWPFKKKETPKVAPVAEPEPPVAEPVVIDPGFAEYFKLADEVGFLANDVLREMIRWRLAELGLELFPANKVHRYLDEVAKARGVTPGSVWLRHKDERHTTLAGCGSPGLQVNPGHVPKRALELVKKIETQGNFAPVKINEDGTEVPLLVFAITWIPKGKGEQVFLAVTDVKRRIHPIFVCSWVEDERLNYRSEEKKEW